MFQQYQKPLLTVLVLALNILAPSAASSCTTKLVGVQTGTSTTCNGDITHYYPLDSSICHGWASSDSSHLNSSKNMRCIDATTFEFDQYAGNLNCEGRSVTKQVKLDECEQDIPPVVYTKGIDLECCKDPDGPSCTTGVASTNVDGSLIYANGDLCDGDGDGSGDGESASAIARINSLICLYGLVLVLFQFV